jgi:hypothetical protein
MGVDQRREAVEGRQGAGGTARRIDGKVGVQAEEQGALREKLVQALLRVGRHTKALVQAGVRVEASALCAEIQ